MTVGAVGAGGRAGISQCGNFGRSSRSCTRSSPTFRPPFSAGRFPPSVRLLVAARGLGPSPPLVLFEVIQYTLSLSSWQIIRGLAIDRVVHPSHHATMDQPLQRRQDPAPRAGRAGSGPSACLCEHASRVFVRSATSRSKRWTARSPASQTRSAPARTKTNVSEMKAGHE